MTATDQVATDARCVCGCPKWDHKQGRATCKNCGCTTYDPAADPEVEKLRAELERYAKDYSEVGAEVAHLREQNHHLREVNVKLGRTEAEVRRLQRDNAALVGERDTARADLEQLRATRRDEATAATVAAQELTKKLSRAAAENKRLSKAADVLAATRDELVHQAKEAQNTAAELRQQRDAAHADRDAAREQAKAAADAAHRSARQVADLEAALVEANEARRMRDADVRLHQDVARAALVVDTSLAFFCPRCRVRFEFNDLDHRCGPMVPVDVITARRPKEQP